mgnify:FL=1
MGNLSNWEEETLSLIEDFINKKGYKLTAQRREIIQVFLRNDQKHLTAEKIHEKLRDSGVGLATVYRNIKIFVDLGIIAEFKVEDTNYYELKMYAKKPLHIHLQCENCGNIEDILNQDIIFEYLKINQLIEEDKKCQIYDMNIMIHGLCRNCIIDTSKK